MKIRINLQSLGSIFEIKYSYEQKYSIQKKSLGSGGNAVVKRAKQKWDNQEIALKMLTDSSKKDQEKKARFIDEIKIMSANAPIIDGIIPILDYSIKECWYTMPIAVPLKNHIKTSNKIEEIIDGVIQLSETLILLHEKGYSHRDIKPDNIFYYNNRYFLGDFGLVDIPDNPNDLTKNGDRIGAKYTIAPEMFRNSKTADGSKADVYSLAKTLWMLLTEDYKGFDGQYNFMEESMSLHSRSKLRKLHLVEIDELLLVSTKNSPEERPTMDEFRTGLLSWKDTYGSNEKVQRSNWNFITKHLFNDNFPTTCSWNNIDAIIKVLNTVCSLPAYNYMFFSNRGGLDFQKAEKSNEEGCIYIYASGMCLLVKPKQLNLEIFNVAEWNYFLLELDQQKAIQKNVHRIEEYLVEDSPGNYVSAQCAQYGVYDYDSGVPFPVGYRTVYRYLDGKLLIVLKDGIYNEISSVSDGRHGDCTASQFRAYITLIKTTYELMLGKVKYPLNRLNDLFNQNPFKIDQPLLKEESSSLKWISSEFINENYEKFCFKDLFEEIESNVPGNIAFFYKFNKNNTINFSTMFSKEKLYLCRDGYIRSLQENDEKILLVYDRKLAINLFMNLEKKLNQFCNANEDDYIGVNFSVSLHRIGKPTHLFTKEEIKEIMTNADDRVNNTLVIDENGFAQIVQKHYESSFYPLRYETWNAGNVYVGKYSRLTDLDDSYIYSLDKWLEYLSTNKKATYQDYVSNSKPAKELIKEIKSFY